MNKLEKLAEETKTAMEKMSGKKVQICQGTCKGETMIGLSIYDPSNNVSPVVYLDQGKDFDIPVKKLAKKILDVIEANTPETNFDTSKFEDFEKAKERIIMLLVNQEQNKELLKEVPYVELTDDLVLIFKYVFGQASVTIRNKHVKEWGASVEELLTIAEKNTPTFCPVETVNLSSFTSERAQRKVADAGYYILSNEQRFYGATAMAYPYLMKRLCKMFHCNRMLVLPISVHELLFYPVVNEDNLERMMEESLKMTQENNKTSNPEEFLSNSVYLYDSSQNGFATCSFVE